VISTRRILPFVLVLAGCYQTPKPACAFLCGADDACPDGYQCSDDDNRCHLVEAGGGLAACTDSLPDDAATTIDAPVSEPDATPLDAASADAFPACAADLNPSDDGSSAARQALVLAEINPGDYLELYNNTASDIDLDTSTVQVVSGGMTVALATAGAGITVRAGGRAVVDWPAALTDATDAGGEVLIYLATPTTAAEIMDFVCWGTAPTTSFKADAVANGKWDSVDPCPDALIAGAIHRVPATTGTLLTDYDIVSAPSPETCAP
jgi:hypothetical protein